MKTLEEQLLLHEGLRLKPYRCTAGRLTIGIGRNIEDKGITEDEAMYMLYTDIDECREDLKTIFPGWHGLAAGRQWALIDLRFNLGPGRFRTFQRMIAAVKEKNWSAASAELKDSLWWSQVQDERKTMLFRQIRTGLI